jgi:hypothetical protein
VHPFLSLRQIDPKAELVKRLPRHLAYYHLAIPIAADEDHITIAMAHPDNQTVVRLMETVMGVAVIPVRSFPDEIRSLLDKMWRGEVETGASGFLVWSDDPAQTNFLNEYAPALVTAFSNEMRRLDAQPDSFEGMIRAAHETRCQLIVTSVSDQQMLATLLYRSPASILLTRGNQPFRHNIIQVLRGHTPDRKVLDWIIPLAHHFQSPITLLTGAAPPAQNYMQGNPLHGDFVSLLATDHPNAEYRRILAGLNILGRLKIRQGLLADVVADELTRNNYDLIAIAAEAYGDFVYRVMQRSTNDARWFLIVKP